MTTIVDRLNFANKKLLIDLQQLAPIAGGAASNPEQAHDIDFFILNNDELTLYSMIYIVTPFATQFCVGDNKYPNSCTILTFQIDKEEMRLQFVLTDNTDVMDLISKFDMDYIQCAFYKQQVVCTSDFKKSNETKQVLSINDYHRYSRFEKAISKHFTTFVFFNVRNVESDCKFVPISDLQIQTLKLLPLMERKAEKIDVNQLKVTGFAIRKIHKDNYKIYYNFTLTDVASARFIALRATVLNGTSHHNYNILELDIVKLECLRIRIATTFTVVKGQTYIFIFELSSRPHVLNNKLERFDLEVVDMFDDTPHVRNIPIAKEFFIHMELAVHSDTRRLTRDAIDFLIESKRQFFANAQTQHPKLMKLNHICEQVFAALAYYIERDTKPFAKVTYQFFVDLQKYFQSATVEDYVLLVAHSCAHVSSLGKLLPLIAQHYKRLEHTFLEKYECTQDCMHSKIATW